MNSKMIVFWLAILSTAATNCFANELTSSQEFSLSMSKAIKLYCKSEAELQRHSLDAKKGDGKITEYGVQESLVTLSEFCVELQLINIKEYMSLLFSQEKEILKEKYERK